jgi:two-component system chemotaxis response regulator CheB
MPVFGHPGGGSDVAKTPVAPARDGDGANELRLLKESGAVTFAQDRDSSVVNGMPGEAVKLDAAMLVLPLEKIAAALTNLVNHQGKNLSVIDDIKKI